MRSQFPVLEQCVYLNTAYVGPPSAQWMQYRSTFDRQFLEEADCFKKKGYERLAEQIKTMATFLGAQNTHTFMVPNFSIGFRFFLEFLPKSTRFLSLQEDYPSLENTIREFDFPCTQLPITATLEADITAALMRDRFDVLALSAVQYTSGVMVDQAALIRVKEQFPHLLILVDGTQFLGSTVFQFEQSPFDLVVSSGYKWLLAGFGNGLAMVSPRFLDVCQINIEALSARVYRGHFDFLAAASLTYAIEQLVQWDFSKLMEQKNDTAAYLRKTLRQRQLLDPMVAAREEHAAIFNIPATEDFYHQLSSQGVRCSYRANGIRLSVHFYNTSADIDRFWAIYDQWA